MVDLMEESKLTGLLARQAVLGNTVAGLQELIMCESSTERLFLCLYLCLTFFASKVKRTRFMSTTHGDFCPHQMRWLKPCGQGTARCPGQAHCMAARHSQEAPEMKMRAVDAWLSLSFLFCLGSLSLSLSWLHLHQG